MSKYNSSFGRANIIDILLKEGGCVHFLGAGGAGMSALCVLSSHFGIKVSASDKARGEYVNMLSKRGIKTVTSEHAKLPSETKLVVYSLAVDEEDPILKEAKAMGVPAVSRAEYLGAIASPYRLKIGVSGSHGKSTTVAMLHKILCSCGACPTTLSGARLSRESDNVHVGSLNCIVFENCEYKDSFLLTSPDVGVFLNLEYDHTDYFKTREALSESFARAIRKCPRPIVYADDNELSEIARNLDTPPILVGKSVECDYRINKSGERFFISGKSGATAEIRLSLIGRFNFINAAMAIAAASECGVSLESASKALIDFYGIKGRLELIGEYKGRAVYLDYAHHPTEIKEGILAVKNATGEGVSVIFGPHTYSRTKSLFEGFVESLSLAECVMLTEIAGIREERMEGVTSAALAEMIGATVVHTPSDVTRGLEASGGAIIVMGAADMSWVLRSIIE